MSKQEFVLEKDKFSKFVTVIKNLSTVCTDCSIKDGKIRQFDDRKNSIYIVDVSTIIGLINLNIVKLADKIELLMPLVKQQVTVKLIIDKDTWSLEDSLSNYKFIVADEKYVNNKYITESEYTRNMNLGDEIVSKKIDKFIVDRILALSKGVSTSMVKFFFENNNCIFKLSSENGIIIGNVLTVPISENISGIGPVPVSPYFMTASDIEFTLYKRNNSKDEIISEMLFNMEGGVSAISYSLSKIVPLPIAGGKK